MADLLAGTVVLAEDTPPTVSDVEATDETNITSTSYAAGAAECSTTFVGATTGRGIVDLYALVTGDGTNTILVSFEIREDDGSGTEIVPANDGRALRTNQSGTLSLSASFPLSGLTAGQTYFARVMHRVTGGTTIDVLNRQIIVGPAS